MLCIYIKLTHFAKISNQTHACCIATPLPRTLSYHQPSSHSRGKPCSSTACSTVLPGPPHPVSNLSTIPPQRRLPLALCRPPPRSSSISIASSLSRLRRAKRGAFLIKREQKRMKRVKRIEWVSLVVDVASRVQRKGKRSGGGVSRPPQPN